MPTMNLKPRDLKLGDVVRAMPYDGPWSTAIVRKIDEKEGTVTLFRPYGTCSDFSYTGGVVCYTGIEEFNLYLSSDREILVYQRNEIK